MRIPETISSNRSREYKKYTSEEISKVIYSWLFTELSHRELDETVLGLNPLFSKGWQSMGILHYLGLKKPHKAIFLGCSLDEGIKHLNEDHQDFSEIISFLSRNTQQN
jgi:5-methylcytosine-specific restriction enzyme A